MRSAAARVLLATVLAAIVVFCVVQDRITAAGARRYVALQQAALAGSGPPVAIDEVVQPAVRRSVACGALSSGFVLAVGGVSALLVSRRRHD